MTFQAGSSEIKIINRLKAFTLYNWSKLSENQKQLAKKGWGIITYKWRWQIAMNIPYLAIFLLDRYNPSVHKFNIKVITAVTSNIPLPEFIISWMGLN